MITFQNEQDMIRFGENLAQYMFAGFILTLDGDLGAGKTTLTKGIGKGLGIQKVINSPTFTIVKVYQGVMPLYHFDAYRLEGQNEELGFEEMFEDEGVCVIEWPMYIEEFIPSSYLKVNITLNNNNSRTIEIESFGKKYDEVICKLKEII